jgi:hypothetical protein
MVSVLAIEPKIRGLWLELHPSYFSILQREHLSKLFNHKRAIRQATRRLHSRITLIYSGI